jgi:hypothetical protein
VGKPGKTVGGGTRKIPEMPAPKSAHPHMKKPSAPVAPTDALKRGKETQGDKQKK